MFYIHILNFLWFRLAVFLKLQVAARGLAVRPIQGTQQAFKKEEK